MSEASVHDLRDIRARQLLVELEAEPQGLTWEQVWPRMEAFQSWSAEELQPVSTGQPKGQNRLQWSANGMDKAGWLLTAAGPLRITRAGRDALREFPDPHAFYAAHEARYAEWDSHRKPPPVSQEPDDLASAIVPWTGGQQLVRSAADILMTEGMRDGVSAFDPQISAWSPDSVAALHDRFSAESDSFAGSFNEQVPARLDGANDEAVLLAAELMALMLLPLSDWKSDSKRQRVKRVLALMADPVHLDARVSAAMDHGAFNGGQAFRIHLTRQFSTYVQMAWEWSRLPSHEQARIWSDPWAWSDFVDGLADKPTPSARAALRFVRHPRVFLPIIDVAAKESIRQTFADEVPSLSEDKDRDLRDITIALQVKSSGPVEYYQSPFVERWQPTQQPGVRRAWLVRGSSVKGMDVVPLWLDEGFVSLAASQLMQIEMPIESGELRQAVEEGYEHLPYAKREEKQRDFHAFVLTMEPGDLVVTTSGGRLFVGKINGQAEQVSSADARSNLRRSVDWAEPAEGVEFADLPAKLAGFLRGGSDVADLTEVADLIDGLIVGVEQPADPGEEVKSTLDSAVVPVELRRLDDAEVEGLLVGRAWLDELVDLLNERKQVILYGPPGTGKTYLAQKVANAVCPPENVRLVQFHPAYAYEDFFEGYRPTKTEGGQVAFALKPGPFRRIVEDAREHPEQPFVLIVDEINRGNLAKVFGELYFLLEYRDEAINLLYGEEDAAAFSLPKNVYLIGTMNTADRSIALVDTAMRRRFAFLSLHPDDKHLSTVLRDWLKRNDLPDSVSELWTELNRRIPDSEFKIGPSYLMTAAVATEQGLDRIWRTAILPLLEEFHYGDGTNVAKRYGLPSLNAAIGQPVDADRQLGTVEGAEGDSAPAGDLPAESPGEP